MKTEKEIRAKINEVEKNYDHVLRGSSASVYANAPRALMQMAATALLDGLFFALGETRPTYEHERKK